MTAPRGGRLRSTPPENSNSSYDRRTPREWPLRCTFAAFYGKIIGMNDPEDTWPLPEYNPGAPRHLHALGVIAVTYASFERSIDSLYTFHPSNQNSQKGQSKYLGMNVAKRIKAVRETFERFENETAVRSAVDNLLDYFDQCNRNRNELMHAEQYPAMFGGEPETLYLIKRSDKRSSGSVYMKFKLSELRSIADYMRTGVVQSAEIHIYLRFRGMPEKDIQDNLRVYVRRGPPQPLVVPSPLHLPHKPQS
jgi:hypothetical protein